LFGAAGTLGQAGESYTLGDGTLVSCEGLLIVNEAMMREVNASGDNTFKFYSGDTYDGDKVIAPGGPFDFSQIYTGNVTDMTSLFKDAASFNQDIGGWDTSQVVVMINMFGFASNFNQDISGWDTSKVLHMESTFFFASSFNQDLSGWNTCHVVFVETFSVKATAWVLPKPIFFGGNCVAGLREINVKDASGTVIANPGALAISTVPDTGLPNTLVLTIENSGTDPLSLGNVYFRNLNNVAIRSVALGTTSVPGGGSTSLTITYEPIANGTVGFDLSITSNDPTDGAYRITVGATAASAKAQAQILGMGAQIVGSFFADSIQANASNRFQQAKGGSGRVFQNNLAQFADHPLGERAPGDAVTLSNDESGATTDPGEALALVSQRMGFVGSDGRIAVTTDDLALAAIELSRFQSAAQVAQLDPDLAANLTTGPDRSGSALAGLPPGDGLDLYAAYTRGHLFKTGAEGYDGYAYAAWQVFEGLNLEGLVSYGGFENKLVYLGETGRPDSQRWITSGKASLDLDWDRYTVSPYGSFN
jgi:surface protein